jgi:hypothetical protein
MYNEYKEDIADLYHRLLTNLKQIPDIRPYLKSCTSLDKLKTEFELYLEAVQKLYLEVKTFNISENEAKEAENILKTYLETIYEEIANEMIENAVQKSVRH